MIWLTWRQFRIQTLVGFGALLLLAIYLVILGRQIHSNYDDTLAHCTGHGNCSSTLGSFADQYGSQVDLLSYLLLVVPGVIGIFWGAPLMSRELEAGTHRLVWNQSVTRSRWLAVKLGGIGLLSMTVAGLYSLLLIWASGPVNTVLNNRFEPVLFATRNIAPLGYAAFAFVLGTTLGLFLRHTVPAMAATLVIFAVLQIVVPTVVRPHYEKPVRTSVPLTAQLRPDEDRHVRGHRWAAGARWALGGEDHRHARLQGQGGRSHGVVPGLHQQQVADRDAELPGEGQPSRRCLRASGPPLLDLPVAGDRDLLGSRRGAGRPQLLADPQPTHLTAARLRSPPPRGPSGRSPPPRGPSG
ncbi:ABC transporter permease subunit [Streptomyces sp. NPDC056638]|uniref:ABC transporter permease subunit n=1 Tax=Streptomyces sp. NPDC056638 TaxID=3345887 RepID=UPI00367C4EF4